QHRAGAIGHLRAVASRNAATELTVAEHRAQPGQAFGRTVRARAFVVLGEELADGNGVADQVRLARNDLVRTDLVAELAGGLGGEGALVRGERERVLVLARHLPALGDLLGGDAHAVGDGD